MKGFKEDWVTPIDELYVIDKVWPNTTPVATAISPGGQEGISAGVGRGIRGRAGFRDDAGTWQRDMVGSGLS